MRNLQEDIAELTRKHEEKRKELEAKHAILAQLGPVIEGRKEPSVYFHSLYGSRGSISFKWDKFRTSQDTRKQPDPELFRFLLTTFPPVARVRVKDGSTSFRPDVTAPGFDRDLAKGMSGLRADETEWRGDLYDCYGVTARIEVYQGPDVRFEWYATVNGQLWEFSIEFPLNLVDLGTLHVHAVYADSHHQHVSYYSECQFQAKHDAQVIRWASGAPEYPNSFTLYWDVDSGKALDFPSLVKLPGGQQ